MPVSSRRVFSVAVGHDFGVIHGAVEILPTVFLRRTRHRAATCRSRSILATGAVKIRSPPAHDVFGSVGRAGEFERRVEAGDDRVTFLGLAHEVFLRKLMLADGCEALWRSTAPLHLILTTMSKVMWVMPGALAMRVNEVGGLDVELASGILCKQNVGEVDMDFVQQPLFIASCTSEGEAMTTLFRQRFSAASAA